MLNLLPRNCPSVSLLRGKRETVRILVGSRSTKLEIDQKIVQDLSENLDSSASYCGNKYAALPWDEFIHIKQDAVKLMTMGKKTAIPSAEWLQTLRALQTCRTLTADIRLRNSIMSKPSQSDAPAFKILDP